MCVALPGKVVWIGDRSETSTPGRLDLGDREADVDLVMVPDVQMGDYVIAHSGYAIRIVDTSSAKEVRGQLGIKS